MVMKDTEAIFTIVLRNLALPNWANLEPEAQGQTIEEVAGLLKNDTLPLANKRQLSTRLDLLQSHLTEAQKERITQVLKGCYQAVYN